MMLSGILAAVAMEWWECCLVCACGVVIGWKARWGAAGRSYGEQDGAPQQRMGKRNWNLLGSTNKKDMEDFNLGAELCV